VEDSYTYVRFYVEDCDDFLTGPYITGKDLDKTLLATIEYARRYDKQNPDKAPHCAIKETIVQEFFFPEPDSLG
jgi:hypothetical protein